MKKIDKAVQWYRNPTEKKHFNLIERVDWMVDNIRPEDKKLLDIGTAGGIIPIVYYDKVEITPEHQIRGIDIYPIMIKEALANKGDRDIKFYVGDVGESGETWFKGIGEQDCITAGQMLEHVDDDNATIKRCYDLLRTGGRIIITVPYKGQISSEHLRIYDEKSFLDLVSPYFTTKHISVVNEQIRYIGEK